MALVPFLYYRANYETHKRLHVVEANKLYRSGCMTVAGFEDAIRKFGIKTVLNLQEESPDPELPVCYLSGTTEKESEMCRRLGVKYDFLVVDLKPPHEDGTPPDAIERFCRLMDDPANWPVLVHCRAGLHRTGVLVAAYRMQYNGWSQQAALGELRGLGFGRMQSYSPNEYIRQYILNFEPRPRNAAAPRGNAVRLVGRGE